MDERSDEKTGFKISHTLKKNHSGDNEEKKKNLKELHALSNSPFGFLPSEIIVNIANHLYGEDFWAFVRTSKSIQEILISYKPFFMPMEKEEIVKIIYTTPLTKTPDLILKWSRTPKNNALPLLRKLSLQFSKCQSKIEKEEITVIKNRLTNYTKILNILYGLGDLKAKEEFAIFYEQIQQDFHSTIEVIDLDNERIPDPKIYRLYFKVFANLSPCVRDSLSKMYHQGADQFKKDEAKSKKYSRPLNLPLSTNSVYEGVG